MKSLRLYYDTLIDLLPQQIFFQLYYRIKRCFRIADFQYRHSFWTNAKPLNFQSYLVVKPSYIPTIHQFLLLNQSYTIQNGVVPWAQENLYGKLWTYHLNYFAFVLQEDISVLERLCFIRQFIAENTTAQVANEPYPIALRGINWIKFLSRHRIVDDTINSFLFTQYQYLAHNLEYHLLGNHLLENGFSLLFAGYYFQEKRWLKKANIILAKQLSIQILKDGAHIELSPMYHQLILERLFDCIQLRQQNALPDALREYEKLKDNSEEYYAQKMLNYLQTITFRNGDIPLINDSATGIAATTKELMDYGAALGFKANPQILSNSGYRKFQDSRVEILMDVGNILPKYQPAHAHCDALSAIVYVNNKPFLVDTGISTYQNTLQRYRERATQSHNTVQIADYQQSEIWSVFRIGRKAKTQILEESDKKIIAQHDGFKAIGILHQRSFCIESPLITIEDSLSNADNYEAKAYWHFHPTVKIIAIIGHRIKTNLAEIILHPNNVTFTITEYQFSEAFNQPQTAFKLTVIFKNILSTTIKLPTHRENPVSILLL